MENRQDVTEGRTAISSKQPSLTLWLAATGQPWVASLCCNCACVTQGTRLPNSQTAFSRNRVASSVCSNIAITFLVYMIQNQTGNINQRQQKPSAGVKTNINNSTYIRPSTYGYASFNGQSP
jgi:hypothetical protein